MFTHLYASVRQAISGTLKLAPQQFLKLHTSTLAVPFHPHLLSQPPRNPPTPFPPSPSLALSTPLTTDTWHVAQTLPVPLDSVQCHLSGDRLLVLSSSRFGEVLSHPLAYSLLAYDFETRVWEADRKGWATPRGGTWQGTGSLALAMGGVAGPDGGLLESGAGGQLQGEAWVSWVVVVLRNGR